MGLLDRRGKNRMSENIASGETPLNLAKINLKICLTQNRKLCDSSNMRGVTSQIFASPLGSPRHLSQGLAAPSAAGMVNFRLR